jgi:ubiquinone/menaquinone biosynthesis C-methylase UbiE
MKNIRDLKFNVDEPGIPQMVVNLCSEFSLSGKKVLEIGCGWGGFIYFLLGQGANVVGIEPTDDDLKTARDDSRLTDATFLKASGLQLPFVDETYDFIFAWEVLEHIPKGTEDLFFAEAYRCLKQGGIMAFSTPSHNFRSIMWDPAYFLLKHRHYKYSQLDAYASKSNFQILKQVKLGNLLLALWNLSTYISKWILRRDTNVLAFPIFLKRLDIDTNRTGWVSCCTILQRA